MNRLGRNFRRDKKKLGNTPDFHAPLTHNLLLTKGQGVASFSRATSATCWCYLESAITGDSPVLQVIPSGIPRFEGARFLASNNTWSNLLSDGTAIPEATLKGGVIEVASTNLFVRSEEVANAGWVKNAVGVATAPVVTANYAIAPNGTLTADRVIFSLNGGTALTDTSLLQQQITVPAGNATSSFYIKSNTVNSYVLGITIPTGSIQNVTVTPEWQRISVSGTSAGTTVSYGLRLRGAVGHSNYADVSIWGAQLEAKPMATSYIPTTTAPVTRNADAITFPNAGNAADTQGTVLFSATPLVNIPNNNTAGDGKHWLLDLGNATGLFIENHTLKLFDGTNTGTLAFIPLADTTYKIALSYGSAGLKVYLNGVNASGSFDGSLNLGTNLTVGGSSTGTTLNWNSTIKNLVTYKRQLTEAQLVKLTYP